MTIMDAVDNLSSMAELDEKQIAVSKDLKAVIATDDDDSYRWLDPKDKEQTMTRVKSTFRVVHDYLKHIYSKDKKHLKDTEMQKGIQAIMVLAGEAAEKVDTCTSLFKGMQEEKISELKEYQNLHKFYFTKIVKRFQEVLESEELWKKEWESVDEDIRDIQRIGLKDLETVKRDRKYELFYIKKEDGRPYFNRNLIRHIKLVSDFDEVISDVEGADPLLRIQLLQDKDSYETAREIRKNCESEIEDFYKDALKFKENTLISTVNKAMIALILTTNPQNLLQHTSGKSCLGYFLDFQKYLREAMDSATYLQWINNPPDAADHLNRALLHVIHALCFHFFTHTGMRQETTNYLYDLIKRGRGGEVVQVTDLIFFLNALLEDHESIMNILKRYPNGPLFKTLDTFVAEEELIFDPIMQQNFPLALYQFSSKSYKATCLKLPGPTKQKRIDKADVLEEFKGYLRHLISDQKKEKLLIFNFQDRTTWEEHARAKAIEELQNDAEFARHLLVVTLPKKTEFYYQTDVYLAVNDAADFLKLLREQLDSHEECGFHFPASLSSVEISKFFDECIPLIHEHFFTNKKKLTRKNRLDFIEIFYQFFMMKILDMTRAEFVSFSCKDGVDIGSTSAGSFYIFLKLMSGQTSFDEDDREFIHWMLFSPALLVRERIVDTHRLNRMVSTQLVTNAQLKKHRVKILKAFESLYDFPSFKEIDLTSSV